METVQRCPECNKLKPVKEFEKTPICKSCIQKTAKIKRDYGLTPREFHLALQLPCFVCGDQATYVDCNQRARKPYGVLCKKCYNYIREILQKKESSDKIQKLLNYLEIREKFPFILTYRFEWLIKEEKEYPLFDYVYDENRNDG